MASEGDFPPKNSDIEGVDYLSDVHFEGFGEEEEVESGIGVIIGAEHAWTWTTGERRSGEQKSVLALKTKFGWGLIGPKTHACSSFPCHFMSSQFSSQDINENLKKPVACKFGAVDEGVVWSVCEGQLRDGVAHGVGPGVVDGGVDGRRYVGEIGDSSE